MLRTVMLVVFLGAVFPTYSAPETFTTLATGLGLQENTPIQLAQQVVDNTSHVWRCCHKKELEARAVSALDLQAPPAESNRVDGAYLPRLYSEHLGVVDGACKRIDAFGALAGSVITRLAVYDVLSIASKTKPHIMGATPVLLQASTRGLVPSLQQLLIGLPPLELQAVARSTVPSTQHLLLGVASFVMSVGQDALRVWWDQYTQSMPLPLQWALVLMSLGYLLILIEGVVQDCERLLHLDTQNHHITLVDGGCYLLSWMATTIAVITIHAATAIKAFASFGYRFGCRTGAGLVWLLPNTCRRRFFHLSSSNSVTVDASTAQAVKSSDKVLTKTATASHHIHANSTTILAPSPPITSTAGVNNRISTALASDINNVTKQISSRVPAAAALPTANPLPADDKQASQQPILSNTMSKKQTDNTTSDTVISHSADNTGNTNSAKDDNSVTVKTPTSEKTTTMTGSNTGGMGPLTPGPGHATSEEVKKMGGTDVPTYKTARMPIFVDPTIPEIQPVGPVHVQAPVPAPILNIRTEGLDTKGSKKSRVRNRLAKARLTCKKVFCCGCTSKVKA